VSLDALSEIRCSCFLGVHPSKDYDKRILVIWLCLESWNAWPIELAFEYRVPDEYPEKIVTSGKGGRDPHVTYPRDEYVYWFRVGFENCRDR